MTDSDTRLAPVWENEAQQHCWLGSLRKNRPHLQDRHNKRLSFSPLDIVMCWCGVWSAINNSGMRESSLKIKPVHRWGKKQERGRENTESQSLASTKDIQPLRFQLCEQVLLGSLVACSQMDPNQYSSDYTWKTTRETKRQGNQCRPGFWPHFCLAPLSQSI